MNEIQALLNSPVAPLVIGVVGIAVLAWGERGAVVKGWSWLKSKAAVVTAPAETPVAVAITTDPHHQRFAAVKLLLEHYTKEDCKEGIAAAQVCLAHLLDHKVAA